MASTLLQPGLRISPGGLKRYSPNLNWLAYLGPPYSASFHKGGSNSLLVVFRAGLRFWYPKSPFLPYYCWLSTSCIVMASSYECSYNSWSSLRPFGDREIVSGTATRKFDFLTFLSVAQALQIRFLNIKWNEAREAAGSGGTSQVDQAVANVQSSFAFKRVKNNSKVKDVIYQALTNEIAVLGHDAVREHPNIAQLQGIGWDISQEDDVPWPVLIFEKTELGNLYEFASSHKGRRMGMNERLNICADLGVAIADMHMNNIIHGDIKPQNALIFPEESGEYRVKAIDFGYSTRYEGENYRAKMFTTPPWTAPEYRSSREWTYSQAVQLDIFSFGLLCFWLLFEHYLCGIKPLPRGYKSGTSPVYASAMHALQDIKEQLFTGTLIESLLENEATLDENRRRRLRDFFLSSLKENPQERADDMQILLKLLHPSLIANRKRAVIETGYFPTIADLRIEISIHDFFRCDYRLRKYIFQTLLEEYQSNPALSMQLAFCYHIGFGVARNEIKSAEILAQNRLDPGSIHEMVTRVPEELEIRSAILLEQLWEIGTFIGAQTNFTQLDQRNWEKAEIQLLQEIDDLTEVFGEDDTVTLLAKSVAVGFYRFQNRWKEAEWLEIEALKATKEAFGEEDVYTLARMNSLAIIYYGQGRSKEAEDMLAHATKITQDVLGEGHSWTLTAMGNLAEVYSQQGRWKVAEEMRARVIDMTRKSFGEDHRQTLRAMSNLTSVYIRQGRLREAEKLLIEIVEAKKGELGEEDFSTLTSMGNLALVYSNSGSLQEAERLLSQTVEARSRIQGREHPITLIGLANLAQIKCRQGRLEEANKLQDDVIEAMKRILGEEHPHTLVVIGKLAATYSKQDRWEEAEKLEIYVMETMKRVLGEKHPNTLTSMSNLAETYSTLSKVGMAEELLAQVLKASESAGKEHPERLKTLANMAGVYAKQGRWQDAEKLELQVMEAMTRVSGEEHPDTITSINNLAVTYQKQGRKEEANELLLRVLKLRAKFLGKDHPDTKKSMVKLMFAFVDEGRTAEADELIKEYDWGNPNRGRRDSTELSDTEGDDSSSSMSTEGYPHTGSKVVYSNPWGDPKA
ncbi:hypothetical protein HD806DRAFT_500721 [Xylariaceae sp. AK1471]|nr:hypothetical protein HD806DRAFT_500721 [Xylariaceae sp. AK1471]